MWVDFSPIIFDMLITCENHILVTNTHTQLFIYLTYSQCAHTIQSAIIKHLLFQLRAKHCGIQVELTQLIKHKCSSWACSLAETTAPLAIPTSLWLASGENSHVTAKCSDANYVKTYWEVIRILALLFFKNVKHNPPPYTHMDVGACMCNPASFHQKSE